MLQNTHWVFLILLFSLLHVLQGKNINVNVMAKKERLLEM